MMEKCDENNDCLVKKHAYCEGTSISLHWPQKDETCCIEMESILKVIQTLTMHNRTNPGEQNNSCLTTGYIHMYVNERHRKAM
jgi:hypothetical protein